MTAELTVLVFKTNVTTAAAVAAIAPYLNQEPEILRWHLDLQDIDYVLRLKTNSLNPEQVIQLLKAAHFHCEELPD